MEALKIKIPKQKAKPQRNKYAEYEYYKKHIQDTAKSHKEYETRIQKLAQKLGI